jgi:adenylate isopentenyltransferase (cytokinin synthase)
MDTLLSIWIPPSSSLRFQSCLLWIQCHELVLKEYLSRRVDNIVDAWLIKELKEYFDSLSLHEFTGQTS